MYIIFSRYCSVPLPGVLHYRETLALAEQLKALFCMELPIGPDLLPLHDIDEFQSEEELAHIARLQDTADQYPDRLENETRMFLHSAITIARLQKPTEE